MWSPKEILSYKCQHGFLQGNSPPSPFLPFRVLKPCIALIFFFPWKFLRWNISTPFLQKSIYYFGFPTHLGTKKKYSEISAFSGERNNYFALFTTWAPGFTVSFSIFPAPQPCHLVALQPQMFLSSLETLVTDFSAGCCVAGSHFLLLQGSLRCIRFSDRQHTTLSLNLMKEI